MSAARNVGIDFTCCLAAICTHSRATHCEYYNHRWRWRHWRDNQITREILHNPNEVKRRGTKCWEHWIWQCVYLCTARTNTFRLLVSGVDVLLFSVLIFFFIFLLFFWVCFPMVRSVRTFAFASRFAEMGYGRRWHQMKNTTKFFYIISAFFVWTMGESLCVRTWVLCICSSFWPTFVDLILRACLLFRYFEWIEIEDRRPSSIE